MVVQLEIVKVLQARWMEWDNKMALFERRDENDEEDGLDSTDAGSKSYGTLCGIILRSQLITILQKHGFGPKNHRG